VLRAAASDRVSLASDLNGDGDTDDSNERVEYRFDATKRALMRVLGGGSPQPMLMDVDSLEFTYLDATGVAVPVSGDAVAAADLARIQRVDVQLTVKIAFSDSGGPAVARNRQTGTAFLRNG
jgi:hypothetical protein